MRLARLPEPPIWLAGIQLQVRLCAVTWPGHDQAGALPGERAAPDPAEIGLTLNDTRGNW